MDPPASEPPPLIPPVPLARFASPHLRFIGIASHITTAGEKEKVILVMQTHLIIASIEGRMTLKMLLPDLLHVHRQLSSTYSHETVVLEFSKSPGSKKITPVFVCLRFANVNRLADTFLNISGFFAPRTVTCKRVQRNEPEIARSVAGITRSRISAVMKNVKPSSTRLAALHQAEAALKEKPPIPAVPRDSTLAKRRIQSIFEAHAPEKIPSQKAIDYALHAFAGEEEQLIASLTQKYGPEPATEKQHASVCLPEQQSTQHRDDHPRSVTPHSPGAGSRGISPSIQDDATGAVQQHSVVWAEDPSQQQTEQGSCGRSRTGGGAPREPSPPSIVQQKQQPPECSPSQRSTQLGSEAPPQGTPERTGDLSNSLMAIFSQLADLRAAVSELKQERSSVSRSCHEVTTHSQVIDQHQKLDDSECDSASGDGDITAGQHATLRKDHDVPLRDSSGSQRRQTEDSMFALMRNLGKLRVCYQELLESASSREQRHGIESFVAPLRAMQNIVASCTSPPAVTRDVPPPLLPAWAIVDFGEINPNVLPPTTRKYRRLIVPKFVPAQVDLSPHKNSSSTAVECLAICTRAEYATADGGWVLPLASIESVCAGALSQRARSNRRTPATSTEDFFNDDLSISICTNRTTVLIKFDAELPRMLWLVKIRENLQARHQHPTAMSDCHSHHDDEVEKQQEFTRWDEL